MIVAAKARGQALNPRLVDARAIAHAALKAEASADAVRLVVGVQPVGIAHAKLQGRPASEPTSLDIDCVRAMKSPLSRHQLPGDDSRRPH